MSPAREVVGEVVGDEVGGVVGGVVGDEVGGVGVAAGWSSVPPARITFPS
jgi:hypothetical protein